MIFLNQFVGKVIAEPSCCEKVGIAIFNCAPMFLISSWSGIRFHGWVGFPWKVYRLLHLNLILHRIGSGWHLLADTWFLFAWYSSITLFFWSDMMSPGSFSVLQHENLNKLKYRHVPQWPTMIPQNNRDFLAKAALQICPGERKKHTTLRKLASVLR